MAYNSRLNSETGHHALPVLLSSRLTLWRTSFRMWPIKRTAYGASASASTPEADFDDNSCGITVGAVIPTARALKSLRCNARLLTFWLADFTADRDFHPALKICSCKSTNYF